MTWLTTGLLLMVAFALGYVTHAVFRAQDADDALQRGASEFERRDDLK